jgi:hypothetical protein
VTSLPIVVDAAPLGRPTAVNRPIMAYVVAWPDGIVKAGYSQNPSRWRGFIARGANLLALSEIKTESEYRGIIEEFGELAFDHATEAVEHLGSGSGGWTECYRIDLPLLPYLALALAAA